MLPEPILSSRKEDSESTGEFPFTVRSGDTSDTRLETKCSLRRVVGLVELVGIADVDITVEVIDGADDDSRGLRIYGFSNVELDCARATSPNKRSDSVSSSGESVGSPESLAGGAPAARSSSLLAGVGGLSNLCLKACTLVTTSLNDGRGLK